MNHQLPPGTYQIGSVDYGSMHYGPGEINIYEPKWEDRFLTQAELEMEELLLGERYEEVFYPNVWDAVVPGYPEKIMHFATKMPTFGGSWMVRAFTKSSSYAREDRIVVTDEYESIEALGRKINAFNFGKGRVFVDTRQGGGQAHMIVEGSARTIRIADEWLGYNNTLKKEKPPKDRNNNGAKWKKQTKPYHQR